MSGDNDLYEEADEQEDLYEHHRFVSDPGQEPLRIDKFLMDRVANATRNKIQVATRAGNVLVNGNEVKPNYKVKPRDVITVVMAEPPRDRTIIPENIPLNIVYEDADVVVVNKSPDMVVHPGHGNYSGTLVNALMYHFKNLPDMGKFDEPRPGLVHRLDKGTSGIMVVAKNELAMSGLAKQFFDRTTDRLYTALVWGEFEEEKGTVTGNIGRSLKNRLQMDVFPDGDQGKHAVTHYRVLERFGYVTLVQCKLETGRTHQIRVHMKHIGHPLFNDERYGGDKVLKGTTFTKYKQFIQNCFDAMPRPALHARSLAFTQPITKERLSFEADLPEDMQTVLDKWRVYISSRKD
ncbi:MAG: RluA family pseudouridine synthase [Flavobacteriales bacterium]|nr:RluA family pseudouridine synthase [Flavobacteriales bacterium]